MPDEFFDRPTPSFAPRRRGPSLRLLGGLVLLAFLGGAALVSWLVWGDRVKITKDLRFDLKPAASASFAALPSPSPAPGASPAASPAPVDQFDQRIAALEQRLTRLDLQAAAAEGNTARAEALLVAFASRRAIDRGVPLGFLADQLKLRFGDAQPNAVATVIESAAQPVTLDQLSAQLDALEPVLTKVPANEDGWTQLKREVAGLFVIRRGDSPSARPENRLDRARLLLRTGQFDAAIKEVQAMPGAAGAQAWVAAAQRHAMAQRALDLIETTALLEPAKLKDGSGVPVQQASPAAQAAPVAPAPSAAPTQAPAPAAPKGAV